MIPIGALLAGALTFAQGSDLLILSPDSETVVTGPTTFAIEIRRAPARTQSVVFYVDGTRACTIEPPQRECEWDAGPRVTSRHVRAVAKLVDGTQVAAALRTRELDIDQRVGVHAVLVSAHVQDSRGRWVKGLTADDFRLFEDGRPQAITSVAAEDASAHVALALDISGSMSPVLPDLKASARRFLDAMRPQDQVTLAGFNTGLFVIAAPTADPAARLSQLERMRSWGRTSLYDSLVRAADLFKTTQGRRALVVFTDGDDVASRGSPDTVRAALQSKDVVLYVAAQGRAADDRDLRERLRDLAFETGGAAFFASEMGALDEHFADIARDIGNQYVLTYTPERPMGDGAWRQLKVELTERKHRVRARQGYFAVRSTDPR